MNSYPLGATITIGPETFKVSSVLTDPDTVTLVVTKPDATSDTYTYAGGTLNRDSVGAYRKVYGPATLEGVYTYVWTGTGAAAGVGEGQFTIDDLLTKRSGDLTTIGRVHDWLGLADSTQDSRLQQLVTAASTAVQDYTLCEFASAQGTVTPRKFPTTLHPRGYWYTHFGRYDLQSAAEVVMDADQTPTGGTVSTYQLAPVGTDMGVYRSLRVYTTLHFPTSVSTYQFGRVVSVKGTWGWPAIPADVEQACLITVAKWFRRDQTSYAPEFGQPDTLEPSMALPYDARTLLQPYKRVLS